MTKVILCRPKNVPGTPRTQIEMRGLRPIAVDKNKYWKGGHVALSVSFLDNPNTTTRRQILAHMNAWSKWCDVAFRETKGTGQVRIARITEDEDPEMSGYWSYVGTDIRKIPLDEPTMNLEGFVASTPVSEYKRVVRHETGHTLGCEHEHMRREIVDRIDHEKAYAYFKKYDGWSREDVDLQVLTPIEDVSLIGTEHADVRSIMCYDLPGSIMKDGKAVTGGMDINANDSTFMAKLFPKKKGKAGKKVGGAKKKKVAKKVAKMVAKKTGRKRACSRVGKSAKRRG
jgi:hypothetical protein